MAIRALREGLWNDVMKLEAPYPLRPAFTAWKYYRHGIAMQGFYKNNVGFLTMRRTFGRAFGCVASSRLKSPCTVLYIPPNPHT